MSIIYIIGIQQRYYPSIRTYGTYEYAKEEYDEYLETYKEEIENGEVEIYFAEVREKSKMKSNTEE